MACSGCYEKVRALRRLQVSEAREIRVMLPEGLSLYHHGYRPFLDDRQKIHGGEDTELCGARDALVQLWESLSRDLFGDDALDAIESLLDQRQGQ